MTEIVIAILFLSIFYIILKPKLDTKIKQMDEELQKRKQQK